MTRCDGSDLCDELAGAADSDFARTYGGKPASRVVASSEHLRVLVDLSPLKVGHLLVVPREHYLSFADVSRTYEAELIELLSCLLPRYKLVFGTPTILEHGSSEYSAGSSCISHAHLHLIPVDGRLIFSSMVKDGMELRRLPRFPDLFSVLPPRTPYYLGLFEDYGFLIVQRGAMRKQYLRALIGAALNIADPEWDWSLVVRKNLLYETLAAMKSSLSLDLR